MAGYRRGIRKLAESESKFIHGGIDRDAGKPSLKSRLKTLREAIEEML